MAPAGNTRPSHPMTLRPRPGRPTSPATSTNENQNTKRKTSPVSDDDSESTSSESPSKKQKVNENANINVNQQPEAESSRRPENEQPREEDQPANDGDADDVPEPANPPQPTIVRGTYWPELRDAFIAANTDNNTIVEIPCVVCGGLLKHPNNIAQTVQPHDEDDYQEDCVILPCGHTIGSSCLAHWETSQRSRYSAYQCPMCRHSLSCSDCNRPFRPYTITVADRNDPSRTIPEGGRCPNRCNGCGAEERLMRWMANGGSRYTDEERANNSLRQWIHEVSQRNASFIRASGRPAFGSLYYHADSLQSAILSQLQGELLRMANDTVDRRRDIESWLEDHAVWSRNGVDVPDESDDESSSDSSGFY